MTTQAPAPTFAVISGIQIQHVLRDRHQQVTEIVENAYVAHGRAQTVNPPSYFLRFPDRPSDRIIALPASVGGEVGVDGVKWVSSFPGNITAGLPRASAVLVLNEQTTGYPFACLEGSIISAARTGASAAVAADWLTRDRERPQRIGFVGAGLIARYVHSYLAGTGWSFDEIGVFDLSSRNATRFSESIQAVHPAVRFVLHGSAESVIRSSDLVIFATVTGEPYVSSPHWFTHNPLILHISLRDLAPAVIVSSANVVDDVEHCLRERTSLHLAEMETGSHKFVDGTLFDVMTGQVKVPPDQPIIFSPFGLVCWISSLANGCMTRSYEPEIWVWWITSLPRRGVMSRAYARPTAPEEVMTCA